MKKFAVSKISFHTNELHTKLVKALGWYGALMVSEFYSADSFYMDETLTIEEAKEQAFNMDEMFEVVEIPENF